jgi:hypothetical protein
MNIVNTIPTEIEAADSPSEKLEANEHAKVSVSFADDELLVYSHALRCAFKYCLNVSFDSR